MAPPRSLLWLFVDYCLFPLYVFQVALRWLLSSEARSTFTLKEGLLAPLHLLNPIVVFGAEHLEKVGSRGVLLAGNHSPYGLSHGLVLQQVLATTGAYPISLYDHRLQRVLPLRLWAEAWNDAVGTRKVTDATMASGSCVLLYPRGFPEACAWGHGARGSGAESNSLASWKGFVRMAIKHGYTIVPFQLHGLSDSLCALCTLDLGWLLPGWADFRLTVPLPFDCLQRQYLAFGAPVPTAGLGQDWEDEGKVLGVVRAVAEEERALAEQLRRVSDSDPDRYVTQRVLRRLRGAGA
ncbi:unnamed protein product [Phaeothamnion confervicola]